MGTNSHHEQEFAVFNRIKSRLNDFNRKYGVPVRSLPENRRIRDFCHREAGTTLIVKSACFTAFRRYSVLRKKMERTTAIHPGLAARI